MGRSRILPRVVATISSAAFLFFVPSAVADVPSELLRASAAFQKALRDADTSAPRLSTIVSYGSPRTGRSSANRIYLVSCEDTRRNSAIPQASRKHSDNTVTQRL